MMFRISESVKHIIIINVIVFLALNIVLKNSNVAEYFLMHFPLNSEFKFWQIFTHFFMHINFDHLLSNMLLLFFLGPMLEFEIRKKKFIFIYVSAGLGAILLSFIVDYIQFNLIISELVDSGDSRDEILRILNKGMFNTGWNGIIGEDDVGNLLRNFNKISLGASGAVMGIVAALGYILPNERIYLMFLPVPIKLKYLAFAYVGSDLVSAILTGTPLLAGTNIGYIAHLGGAITGVLIAMYWRKTQFNKNRWN